MRRHDVCTEKFLKNLRLAVVLHVSVNVVFADALWYKWYGAKNKWETVSRDVVRLAFSLPRCLPIACWRQDELLLKSLHLLCKSTGSVRSMPREENGCVVRAAAVINQVLMKVETWCPFYSQGENRCFPSADAIQLFLPWMDMLWLLGCKRADFASHWDPVCIVYFSLTHAEMKKMMWGGMLDSGHYQENWCFE